MTDPVGNNSFQLLSRASTEALATYRAGTAILDFGDTPDDFASVDVTDQDGIRATSHVRVWFQAETMANNSSDDHILAGLFTKLVVSDPVPNEGFAINCIAIEGLFTKRFRVDWVWS